MSDAKSSKGASKSKVNRTPKRPGARLPKNKRDPGQAEIDRIKIAEMYLAGQTQHEIAQAIGVSQQQIAYDLKIIRQRWREAQIKSYSEHIELQLAKVDHAERELWKAWYATQGEEEIVSHEAGMTPKGEVDKTTVRRRKIHGTSSYMDGILKCIDQRSKLLQLDVNAAILATVRAGYDVVNPMTGESMKEKLERSDDAEDEIEAEV